MVKALGATGSIFNAYLNYFNINKKGVSWFQVRILSLRKHAATEVTELHLENACIN